MVATGAVQIVKQKSGGGFELNESVLKNILLDEKVQNLPFLILSITGPFRSGKSFLLNFIIEYLEKLEKDDEEDWIDEVCLDKVEFSSGADAHTKGIWMWNKAFVIYNEKFKKTGKYAVLVMDTQGTFDEESDTADNAGIFAISTFLSSVQIFNIKQQVDESQLQSLRLFSSIGRCANKHGSEKPFQTLLFLIRDFQATDDYEIGYEGGMKYIKKKLESQGKTENRELREDIQASFETVKGYLMPVPDKVIHTIQPGQKISEIAKQSSEFLKAIETFVEKLFLYQNLTIKVLNHQELNGQKIFEKMIDFMKMFDNGEIPMAKDMYSAVAESSINDAMLAAFDKFKETFDSAANDETVFTDKIMVQQHFEDCKLKALKIFEDTPKFKTPKGKAEKDALDRLNQLMTRHYENCLTVIDAKIRLRKEEEKLKEEQERSEENHRRLEEEKARLQEELEQGKSGAELERLRLEYEMKREESNREHQILLAQMENEKELSRRTFDRELEEMKMNHQAKIAELSRPKNGGGLCSIM